MSDPTDTPTREDAERQLNALRDDLADLTRLLREAGEAKAAKAREAALAEAAEVLERSRAALHAGETRARAASEAVESYIREKPVQSALIALGVGFLVGLLTRR